MSASRFLISNGVLFQPSDSTPPITTLLEAHPGAYTTTRSHGGGSRLLFWKRHVDRLCESVRILSSSHPHLLFGADKACSDLHRSVWESELRGRVHRSVAEILPVAVSGNFSGEEVSLTVLVAGSSAGDALGVHVHAGNHKPLEFGVNGAKLAVVGRRREAAEAKYSDWVRSVLNRSSLRVRKGLEKLRPPSATELLLSNDGDELLEGGVSNFFVVSRKDDGEANEMGRFEVQTAPVMEGVLPGIIRRLIIEICTDKGIPFREVAPSWARREVWEEAFITNSLRLIQHVESISVPNSWESLLLSDSWKDISWDSIHFQESPGMITRTIQRELMEKAALEGFSFGDIV